MSKEKTSIGAWLYWSLIVISTLSYGLLNLPLYVTHGMGANAYLALPIGAILAFPALGAVYLLMVRFPKKNLVQISIEVFGTVLGRLFGAGYLLCLLLLLVVFTRDTINLIFIFLLDLTPLTVLAVTYLLMAGYLASRGIETISRLASFVVLPSLLMIVLLLAGILPDISIRRLMPVFYGGLNRYFIGGGSALNAYFPLAFVALITPYLVGIRSKVPRLTLYAGVILVGLFTLIVIGTIGVFGHEHARRFAYPGLEAIRTIEFPFLLLEQAGLLMVIVWIVIILVGSAFFYYGGALGLSQVFGLLDYKRFVWILFPIKLVAVLFPVNLVETKMAFGFIARNGWIPFFVFPLFLYIATLVLKKGSSQ